MSGFNSIVSTSMYSPWIAHGTVSAARASRNTQIQRARGIWEDPQLVRRFVVPQGIECWNIPRSLLRAVVRCIWRYVSSQGTCNHFLVEFAR